MQSDENRLGVVGSVDDLTELFQRAGISLKLTAEETTRLAATIANAMSDAGSENTSGSQERERVNSAISRLVTAVGIIHQWNFVYMRDPEYWSTSSTGLSLYKWLISEIEKPDLPAWFAEEVSHAQGMGFTNQWSFMAQAMLKDLCIRSASGNYTNLVQLYRLYVSDTGEEKFPEAFIADLVFLEAKIS